MGRDRLGVSPFYDILDENSRTSLSAAGTEVRYPAGRSVLGEGLPGDSIAVIRGGRVKVFVNTAEGVELLLGIRGPGDLLGEMAVATGTSRSASVTAIDDVLLLLVPRSAFDDLRDRRPDISRALIRVLAERVREADQHRIALERNAEARVAEQLVALAERFGVPAAGDAVTIDLPLSQDELAGLTWTSRSALTSSLRRLRDEGLLATTRRKITILDLDALRALT